MEGCGVLFPIMRPRLKKTFDGFVKNPSVPLGAGELFTKPSKFAIISGQETRQQSFAG